jgi:hypothetical protein
MIPLVKPTEKMNDVKRKIYQTLMEYKVYNFIIAIILLVISKRLSLSSRFGIC